MNDNSIYSPLKKISLTQKIKKKFSVHVSYFCQGTLTDTSPKQSNPILRVKSLELFSFLKIWS